MRGLLFLTLAANLGSAFAQVVDLGLAASYGVLAHASISNSGPTTVNGDIGTTGTSIVGFPPGVYTGNRNVGLLATTAFNNAEAAYTTLGQLPGIILVGNLGGRLLPPGVYRFPTAAVLSGTLILAGQGSPCDSWVFLIGSTLSTSVGSSVIVTGGGNPGNVFWRVGASATIQIGSQFSGNILAGVAVTLNPGASIQGSVYALGSSVVLNSNEVAAQANSCPLGASTSTSVSSTSTTASSDSSTSTDVSTTTDSSTSTTTDVTTTTSSDSSTSTDVSTTSTSTDVPTNTSTSTDIPTTTDSSTSTDVTTTTSTSTDVSTTDVSTTTDITTATSTTTDVTTATSTTTDVTTATSTSTDIPTATDVTTATDTTTATDITTATSTSTDVTTTTSTSTDVPTTTDSSSSSSSVTSAFASLTSTSTASLPSLTSSTIISVTNSSAISSPPASTTSIVYATTVYTITKCPATVTNCPIGSATTELISLYTTVCPVAASATKQPPSGYTVSTVFTTIVYTITKCPKTVTNCPVGSVTTEIRSLYTTTCPVTQSFVNSVLTPQSSIPARPASSQLPAAVLPSRISSIAIASPVSTVSLALGLSGAAPVSSVSPASGPSSVQGSVLVIGAPPSSNLVISTVTASKGTVNVSQTSQPSAAYTGPISSSGVMNKGTSASLLVLAIGALLFL
ncbi:hypothetical protein VE01_08688 [Pseudogymnoascus verrucosus]|uniref:DUF3494 domain-containing protein n=1 Tax=Pseudogymnoascus verrucosus TaxID=342668 RepID=A0A1B8GC71_9PEZI|nr:uncharacterized protein VE01_08688 [Pseudogymnoascus verrucosus]OBT93449.1 hypothetical protein VE01_08688 [Pseudogymnoascus verrucosus]